MDSKEVLKRLRVMSDPKWVETSRHFGIQGKNVYGISVPKLRAFAREIGKNHRLALDLWKTGVHEARILATMIDSPQYVTEEQMEAWVKDFDSWDICDQACGGLFDKMPFAYKKAAEWMKREREYEKRAGFSLIAYLAVHNKNADDTKFLKFLPMIKIESVDDRNFVKKAVNWALREIGKRNKNLNREAIKTAKEIRLIDSKSAKWIAADALRELQGEAVQKRLKN